MRRKFDKNATHNPIYFYPYTNLLNSISVCMITLLLYQGQLFLFFYITVWKIKTIMYEHVSVSVPFCILIRHTHTLWFCGIIKNNYGVLVSLNLSFSLCLNMLHMYQWFEISITLYFPNVQLKPYAKHKNVCR